MNSPEIPALPILMGHEASRVLVVLVQVILNAARFGSCDLDELLQLRF